MFIVWTDEFRLTGIEFPKGTAVKPAAKISTCVWYLCAV